MKIESLPNGVISNLNTIKNTNSILNTKPASANMNGINHASVQRKGRFNIVNTNIPCLPTSSIPNIPPAKQMNLNSSAPASESTTGTGTAPGSPGSTSINSINSAVALAPPSYPPDSSTSTAIGTGNPIISNNGNITAPSGIPDEATSSINSISNTKQPKSPVLKLKKKGRFLLTTTRAPDALPLYNSNVNGEKISQQIKINAQIPNRATPTASISPSLSLEDQDVNHTNISMICQNNQQVPTLIQSKENSVNTKTTLACNGSANADYKNSRLAQFILMCDQMKAEMLDMDKYMQKLQMEMKLIQTRNKDLEIKNKEIELRYLEEKRLREQAESKVELLGKERKKYTIYDSNQKAQDTNPSDHTSSLGLPTNIKAIDSLGDQQDYNQDRIESGPVHETRTDFLSNYNKCESMPNINTLSQADGLYLSTSSKSAYALTQLTPPPITVPPQVNTKPQSSISVTSSEFDPFNNDTATDLSNKLHFNTKHQQGVSVREMKSDSPAPETNNFRISTNESLNSKTSQTNSVKEIRNTAELKI